MERDNRWIHTYTGRKFWPLDARPEDVSTIDIAHALSMNCRYNGHSRIFMSVAHHSLLVYKMLKDAGYPPFIQFLGLIHDASEAYMSDICRPIKYSLPMYTEYEDKLMRVILQHYGIDGNVIDSESWEPVKWADNAILYAEARYLFDDISEWAFIGVDETVTPYLEDIEIGPRPRLTVEAEFIAKVEELLSLIVNEKQEV